MFPFDVILILCRIWGIFCLSSNPRSFHDFKPPATPLTSKQPMPFSFFISYHALNLLATHFIPICTLTPAFDLNNYL
ncbi:hypothetical protein L208DRAFT_1385957 [Tricholoma matsutake]|nr:hypothetical protein L208DRAFT_1385957 [Tricholoma matsutake 945]